jgi:hypothetical protein
LEFITKGKQSMFSSGRTANRLLTAFVVMGLSQLAPCLAEDKPVLVELFTSEGCSSCPPADQYLSTLRQHNKNVILIGEHVDYWNNLGWADPFSSPKWTERQREYCEKLGANSCYTPQAVINGQRECVGSNQSAVQDAISSTPNALSVPIAMKIARGAGNSVDISLVVGNSSRTNNVSLFLVEDGVSVYVQRGENGGRKLSHDGIVRSHTAIKNIKSGERASASLPLQNTDRSKNFRIVAILEDEKGPFGATQQSLSTQ